MAYRPECQGEIGVTDISCSYYGFDFALREADSVSPSKQRSSCIACSSYADFAIAVSILVSAVGCVLIPLSGIRGPFNDDWLIAMLATPVTFVLQFGIFVLFIRLRDM